MNFYDFNFDDQLMDSLEAMRFKEATPVQEQAIPVIMDGKDLIACAQTGTGKTAAYLLPVINRLVTTEHTGVNTIVLVPTRELAQQIDQQMEGFAYFVPVTSSAIYGGNDSSEWERQRVSLVEGADIVITTPGRMLQHLAMGYVDFSHVEHLILDEADRMLDMGFYEDIMQVVNVLPKERQTLMFSATMPPKIRELAKAILREPAEINIAISKPAEGVKQGAFCVYDAQKFKLVQSILANRKDDSVIIFSSRKTSVKELGRVLIRSGFNAGVIHSDLEQAEREAVLLDFKNRNINILVATDIIARGIDIEKIDMVINYDVPRDAEDYVHRVGRTARAKTQGEAYTFINEDDMFAFGNIERLIEMEIEKLPLPAELGEGPAYTPGRRGRKPSNRQNGRPESNGRNQRRDTRGDRRRQPRGAEQPLEQEPMQEPTAEQAPRQRRERRPRPQNDQQFEPRQEQPFEQRTDAQTEQRPSRRTNYRGEQRANQPNDPNAQQGDQQQRRRSNNRNRRREGANAAPVEEPRRFFYRTEGEQEEKQTATPKQNEQQGNRNRGGNRNHRGGRRPNDYRRHSEGTPKEAAPTASAEKKQEPKGLKKIFSKLFGKK